MSSSRSLWAMKWASTAASTSLVAWPVHFLIDMVRVHDLGLVHRHPDNGPQFSSAEFKDFMVSTGTSLSASSPYNPRSNGLSEAAVKSAKNLLVKATANGVLDSDGFMMSVLELLVSLSPRRTNLSAQQAQWYNRGTAALTPLPIGCQVVIQDAVSKHWATHGVVPSLASAVLAVEAMKLELAALQREILDVQRLGISAVMACTPPDGFEDHDGLFYFLGNDKVTQFKAKQICNKQGAHLAQVTTEEQFDSLHSFIPAMGKSFYGIVNPKQENCSGPECKFYFISDGSEVNLTMWLQFGFDVDAEGDVCLHALTNLDLSGSKCYNSYIPICTLDCSPDLPKGEACANGALVPEDYFNLPEIHWKMANLVGTTTELQENCRADQGNLAMIKSQEDFNNLMIIRVTTYFI
eukprot:snap_masked-scaffold123_size333416-processed-gene-1.5 protein:Tk05318 transcript:snap_masked-scaffold123_size333416-processed-gene-1.5-mRNA-1 annotation:"PREDICTED: uncharacterized protein K02A2.6-like"